MRHVFGLYGGGLGRRSGLFPPNSKEAEAADRIAQYAARPSPRGLGGAGVQRTEEHLARLMVQQRYNTVIVGPRDDAPAGYPVGVGPRVRWGLLDDGSFGVERWTQGGVRQTPVWS